MFEIIFYETTRGRSELLEFLEGLRLRSASDKDSRIQYKQILLYIELLQTKGTNLPVEVAKHISDDIWELRPGNNRVLYFYNGHKTFVLLHHFRKKTNKTPRREIEKAEAEKVDYLRRKGS